MRKAKEFEFLLNEGHVVLICTRCLEPLTLEIPEGTMTKDEIKALTDKHNEVWCPER